MPCQERIVTLCKATFGISHTGVTNRSFTEVRTNTSAVSPLAVSGPGRFGFLGRKRTISGNDAVCLLWEAEESYGPVFGAKN